MKPRKSKWTREQKEEERFRELVSLHRDSLEVVLKSPEKLKLLEKIARG